MACSHNAEKQDALRAKIEEKKGQIRNIVEEEKKIKGCADVIGCVKDKLSLTSTALESVCVTGNAYDNGDCSMYGSSLENMGEILTKYKEDLKTQKEDLTTEIEGLNSDIVALDGDCADCIEAAYWAAYNEKKFGSDE